MGQVCQGSEVASMDNPLEALWRLPGGCTLLTREKADFYNQFTAFLAARDPQE